MSQAAVWRENILSSGNKTCKGPGDHQGSQCGGTEWGRREVEVTIPDHVGPGGCCKDLGVIEVQWEQWKGFELRRDVV